MLYVDLEDLKQSKSDGGIFVLFFGETESHTPFIKEPNGCIISPPRPAESDVWPTMPSREQRGYQNSDCGGDHYYVGCLHQTKFLMKQVGALTEM